MLLPAQNKSFLLGICLYPDHGMQKTDGQHVLETIWIRAPLEHHVMEI